MSIPAVYLEENQPFDFAGYGIVRGAIIRGIIDAHENIGGVVEKVFPRYVVVRRHSGVRVTVHFSHVLCGEAVFTVVNRKKRMDPH